MVSESSSNFNTYFLTHFFDKSPETRRTDRGNLRHTFHDILLENQLYWFLGVSFGEDQSRKRTGNFAENFNIIFKSALAILKKEKSIKKA